MQLYRYLIFENVFVIP